MYQTSIEYTYVPKYEQLNCENSNTLQREIDSIVKERVTHRDSILYQCVQKKTNLNRINRKKFVGK